MGYKTYTDFAINSNMAKTPQVVSSFLRELSKTVKHKTDKVLTFIIYFIHDFYIPSVLYLLSFLFFPYDFIRSLRKSVILRVKDAMDLLQC